MTDVSQAAWRKASTSVRNGGCVEVAADIPRESCGFTQIVNW